MCTTKRWNCKKCPASWTQLTRCDDIVNNKQSKMFVTSCLPLGVYASGAKGDYHTFKDCKSYGHEVMHTEEIDQFPELTSAAVEVEGSVKTYVMYE